MYLKVTAQSACLGRAVDFHVLLPTQDGYPAPPVPYRTLYLLPGYSASAEEIAFSLPLRQMATLYGFAVVLPDGENSFYTDHPERASCHGQYAGEELVRITRRLFPSLSCRREDTFLGGISMGGYGALMLGLKYRDTFSGLVMFSPAADPKSLLIPAGLSPDGTSAAPEVNSPDAPPELPAGLFAQLFGDPAAYESSSRLNPMAMLKKYRQEGLAFPPLWMCCGDQDQVVGESCLRLREALFKAGAPLRWESGPGGHDFPYWDDHLESAFRFLAEISREPA